MAAMRARTSSGEGPAGVDRNALPHTGISRSRCDGTSRPSMMRPTRSLGNTPPLRSAKSVRIRRWLPEPGAHRAVTRPGCAVARGAVRREQLRAVGAMPRRRQLLRRQVGHQVLDAFLHADVGLERAKGWSPDRHLGRPVRGQRPADTGHERAHAVGGKRTTVAAGQLGQVRGRGFQRRRHRSVAAHVGAVAGRAVQLERIAARQRVGKHARRLLPRGVSGLPLSRGAACRQKTHHENCHDGSQAPVGPLHHISLHAARGKDGRGGVRSLYRIAQPPSATTHDVTANATCMETRSRRPNARPRVQKRTVSLTTE